MSNKNIILFLTDQWRWDILNDSTAPARTPNLDAFRKQSTNFVNAFSPVPLCTPARASLFTGKWPHQTGTMDNVQGTSFYPHGKLHPSNLTYLERLQEQGYDVSFIGKWHLGAGTLIDRGIVDAPLSDGGQQALVPAADIEFDGPRRDPFYGTITAGSPMDEQRVALGIDRLSSLAQSDRPFCLVVSLQGPHFPHHVPEKWVRLYDDLPQDYMPSNYLPQFTEQGKPLAQGASYWPCQDTRALSQQDWRRTAQHYWGFCSYIDDMFGQFRTAMTANELDDNTVLAFTADHGEMLGAHGWFDKGPFFYEEVMRIPMLIRSAGQQEGSETLAFVSLRDLFPSLVSAAGAQTMLTEDEKTRVYGANTDHVTYCYDAYQGRQFKFRGIRGDRYKYSWSPHDLAELYDLVTDPGERVNLVDEPAYASIRNGLHEKLCDWMRTEHDPLAHDSFQLPVGSYVDGRDRTEQHAHSTKF